MLVDCGNIQVKVRLLQRTEGENPFSLQTETHQTDVKIFTL